jgi:hypothetical protein
VQEQQHRDRHRDRAGLGWSDVLVRTGVRLGDEIDAEQNGGPAAYRRRGV